MAAYANEYDNKYPAVGKWCDLLVEHDYTTEKQFVCKAAERQGDTGQCHYAMNPDCEPNSPGDVVLLFETKGGWNQSGGPEILTTENHGGKGCNILFNDGSVKFIPADEFNRLKWE
jgi:prepilin-type processing-associated H-X9-DG protein